MMSELVKGQTGLVLFWYCGPGQHGHCVLKRAITNISSQAPYESIGHEDLVVGYIKTHHWLMLVMLPLSESCFD